MKIATILYTYVRYEHTQKVLNALMKNTELPEKLFIFQDGLKDIKNKESWEKTNKLIKSVSWCDCEIIVADKNKGLAKSIVDGINYVFNEYDAAIVLEDDCVPHSLFLSYMHNALRYYENLEKVYSISGYGHPLEVSPNGTDVYFTQRFSSWGWGTWKDRWKDYKEDYRILGRMKKDPYLSQQLYYWGEDLENYVLGNIYGRCNSWAVFWALNILEQDGYCVYPYKSLIYNIGLDGSGEHCGIAEQEIELLQQGCEKEFIFCNDFSISEQTKMSHANYLTWKSADAKNSFYYNVLLKWMELHMQGKTINAYFETHNANKICIWGKGRMCDLILQEFNEATQVLAIIESKPSENTYRNINIVDSSSIPENTDVIVMIPEYDWDRIMWKIDKKWHFKVKKLSEIIGELL